MLMLICKPARAARDARCRHYCRRLFLLLFISRFTPLFAADLPVHALADLPTPRLLDDARRHCQPFHYADARYASIGK